MNAKDRALFEEQSKTLKEIHTVLVGSPEYKIKGLLERQEADEEFQKEVMEEIKEFKANQQETWKKIENNYKLNSERLDKHFEKIKDQEKRISLLEKFHSFIDKLRTMPKRSAAIITTLLSGVLAIIAMWEKVKQFVYQIYHHLTS